MFFICLYWYIIYIIYKNIYFHWYFTQYMPSEIYDLFSYIILVFFQSPHLNNHQELDVGKRFCEKWDVYIYDFALKN